MSELAMYLRSARAILRVTTKSLARALQISDNIVTKLETEAHIDDPVAKHLMLYYKDLGLHFQKYEETEDENENKNIVGISIVNIKELVFSAADRHNPEDLINKLLREMRYIGGMIYNFQTVDKTKASRYDSIRIHFPIPMRGVARQILGNWCDTEEPLKVLYDGSFVNMDKEKLDDLLGIK